MSGFDGYDQWKTASPYDDFDDTVCVECGGPLDLDSTEDHVVDGYCSVACEAGEKVPGGICRALWDTLGPELGQDPGLWSNRLYRATECGAWLKIHDHQTVEIGSIVEGSDAECECHVLTLPFSKAEFWNRVEDIEHEADHLWKEANDPDYEEAYGI